jgi:alanine racemase
MIDLGAIRHNYLLAKALAPGTRAVAIVKADAYGHGAIPVARTLAGVADAFGVACLEEAAQLRDAGIQTPILLLEGPFEPAELPDIDALSLTSVIHTAEQIHWILDARPARKLHTWLKMDSGMHRVGLDPADYQDAYNRLARCPHVGDIVLMTHFARADELHCDSTTRQLACFSEHTAGLPAPRSLANSAAVMAWPDTHGDWTRPGIMLYGATPLPPQHPAGTDLRPAMHLQSALISIRELAAGEPIGYGARFICERPTRVGVVAVGYADGYPRHARDGTPLAVNGEVTRLIGRVSMDMLTVDLTDMPAARIGDPVELWGPTIPANHVAAASDTIAYQLFTGVSRRVPLHYRSP